MNKKSKIRKFSEGSKLMNIDISYDGEIFRFNLFKELVIDENKINSELQEQPSYYGFLGMLNTKLTRLKEDKDAEVDKLYAKAYIKAKNQTNTQTNRPNNDDLAKQIALADKKYNNAKKELNELKEQAGIINTCLKSFEQRSHLIQSISANLRKEK